MDVERTRINELLIVVSSQSDKCHGDLGKVLQLFSKLGVLVAEKKMEGPSTHLLYQGNGLSLAKKKN